MCGQCGRLTAFVRNDCGNAADTAECVDPKGAALRNTLRTPHIRMHIGTLIRVSAKIYPHIHGLNLRIIRILSYGTALCGPHNEGTNVEIPSKHIMVEGRRVPNPAYFAYRNAQLAQTAPVQTALRVRAVARQAPPRASIAENVRAWREANPDKVKAQRDRAAAARAAKAAARQALLAAPAGTPCEVCGTLDGVQKDTRRNDEAVCNLCLRAVGFTQTAQRAAQYREAIERYLTRASLLA